MKDQKIKDKQVYKFKAKGRLMNNSHNSKLRDNSLKLDQIHEQKFVS